MFFEESCCTFLVTSVSFVSFLTLFDVDSLLVVKINEPLTVERLLLLEVGDLYVDLVSLV